LPPASVHAVLESLLGPDPRLAKLKELIVRRTEGNPFFVEETVRTLIEARILVGSRGSFELTEVVDAVEVPPTVQAVLAARIDRLGLEERRLLQAAAVIGRTVPLNLLAALVDMPDAERDSRSPPCSAPTSCTSYARRPSRPASSPTRSRARSRTPACCRRSGGACTAAW